MKKYFFLLLLILINTSEARNIPRPSHYDSRIRHENYNPEDVTMLRISLGRIASIVFSKDERIIDAHSGFRNGWNLHSTDNILYIGPVAPNNSEGEISFSEKELFANNYWDTNLIVRTNKNMYFFDLRALPENQENKSSFTINFAYPKSIAAYQRLKEKLVRKALEKKEITNKLNNLTLPKNWNYTAKAAPKSQSITPSFVYDDGTNTFVGFEHNKSLPAFFTKDGNKEMLVNSTVRQYNEKYNLVKINNTHLVIVLRKSEEVVAIFNHAFNKNTEANKSDVERDVNE